MFKWRPWIDTELELLSLELNCKKKPKYLSSIGGQYAKPLSQKKGFPGTEVLKLDSKIGIWLHCAIAKGNKSKEKALNGRCCEARWSKSLWVQAAGWALCSASSERMCDAGCAIWKWGREEMNSLLITIQLSHKWNSGLCGTRAGQWITEVCVAHWGIHWWVLSSLL